MAMKNYRSEVEAYQSLGEIQGALAKAGARQIMVEYDTAGNPAGLRFAVMAGDRALAFMLPANVAGVQKVLERQHVKSTDEQAQRTAWRNLRDWVLAQLALIESGMAQVDEPSSCRRTEEAATHEMYNLRQTTGGAARARLHTGRGGLGVCQVHRGAASGAASRLAAGAGYSGEGRKRDLEKIPLVRRGKNVCAVCDHYKDAGGQHRRDVHAGTMGRRRRYGGIGSLGPDLGKV